MSVFTAFEIEVLKLMAPSLVPTKVLDIVAREASLVSCEYTGSGYFTRSRIRSCPAKRSLLVSRLSWGMRVELIAASCCSSVAKS